MLSILHGTFMSLQYNLTILLRITKVLLKSIVNTVTLTTVHSGSKGSFLDVLRMRNVQGTSNKLLRKQFRNFFIVKN